MPLAPLLIPVGEILVWAVALAFCLLVVYIAKAFFGTAESAVGWIPFIGKVLERPLVDIEHKIVGFMSGAANAVDDKIGAAFHQLARLVDWLGHELAAHANILATLATLTFGSTAVDAVRHAIRAVRAQLHSHEHAIRDTHRHLRTVDKRIAHGIGEDVLPRLRAAEREVGHVIAHDLPAIRAREKALEHGGANLWKWVRTHPLALGSTAFAGAVAYALSRIGAGWVRCSNVRRAGRNVCGMDATLLESLLADTLLVVGTLSLVEFAEEMQGVTETAVRPITTFWRAS